VRVEEVGRCKYVRCFWECGSRQHVAISTREWELRMRVGSSRQGGDDVPRTMYLTCNLVQTRLS
jgi:hypothetical protein